MSYPAIWILSLKFHAQLEMNIIFFIIKLVRIVHIQTNNNYYHVCYRERILVIKSFQVICQICYAMVKKLATALCALLIIKKMYHQFNSGMQPCCETHYLSLRMGSSEFVTHQRWVTFILSKGVENPYKGRMSRACW